MHVRLRCARRHRRRRRALCARAAHCDIESNRALFIEKKNIKKNSRNSSKKDYYYFFLKKVTHNRKRNRKTKDYLPSATERARNCRAIFRLKTKQTQQ